MKLLNEIQYLDGVELNLDQLNLIKRSVLRLSFIPSEISENKKKASIDDWSFQTFNSTFMTLKVNFDRPLLVSQSFEKDTILIEFLQEQLFQSKSGDAVLGGDLKISQKIPRQLGSMEEFFTISN